MQQGGRLSRKRKAAAGADAAEWTRGHAGMREGASGSWAMVLHEGSGVGPVEKARATTEKTNISAGRSVLGFGPRSSAIEFNFGG